MLPSCTVASQRWFVRRRIGFGARPASWQGWLLTVFALAAIIGGVVGLKRPASVFWAVGVALLYQAVVPATLPPGPTRQRLEQVGVDGDHDPWPYWLRGGVALSR